MLHVLHESESHHFAGWRDGNVAAASCSRTIQRLVRRGLIEKFRFAAGAKYGRDRRSGSLNKTHEIRWRLTEQGKKFYGLISAGKN